MTDDQHEPDDSRSRPETEESYGIPDHKEGMLSWSFVAEKLSGDRFFWVSTTRPDGNPHARPVWGVWVDGTFYCGGGERTRWVRNLAVNPGVVVHREDAEEVVILEGTAEKITAEAADSELIEAVDSAYEEKYETRHGTPFFAVRPDRVLAWSEYPTDAMDIRVNPATTAPSSILLASGIPNHDSTEDECDPKQEDCSPPRGEDESDWTTAAAVDIRSARVGVHVVDTVEYENESGPGPEDGRADDRAIPSDLEVGHRVAGICSVGKCFVQ